MLKDENMYALIRIFLNRRMFLSGYGHTHLANSTVKPDILKSTLKGGKKNESSANPIMCGGANRDIFESDEVANSCPVSY